MKTPPRARSRGFTLVEVLAAMLIIALVLPVAMRGVSIAMYAASHAKNQTLAASLAESKLNELAVSGTPASTGSSGDFSPEHPDYEWEFSSNLSANGLYEMNLRVTWNERGQRRDYVLSTLHP